MFGFILAVIAGVVAVAIIIAVLRIIAELLIRVIAALAIVVLAGLIGGIVAAQLGYDGALSALVVAVTAFFPTLFVVWHWRGPVADGLGSSATPKPERKSLSAAPVVSAVPVERELRVTDADALASAWDAAERLAPRERLNEPRAACARLLAAFGTASHCDPAAIDMAVFIRRHVPGLLEDTQGVLVLADADERRTVICNMVAELRQLGEDADRMLASMQSGARDRLRTRQGRFALRRAEREDWK